MTSHTAEYWFIELALDAHARSFAALESQMDSFQPLPLAAFANERESLMAQIRASNSGQTDAELKSYVEKQMLGYSPDMQFATRFAEPFAAEAIAITVLSHALVEATINAVVALGLAHVRKADLFAIFERADIKDKWTVGPLAFLPAYVFDRSTAAFETLTILCRRRNSYVHSKLELRDDDDRVLIDGSRERSIDHSPEGRGWLRRFLALPYELHRNVNGQIADTSLQFAVAHILQGKGRP